MYVVLVGLLLFLYRSSLKDILNMGKKFINQKLKKYEEIKEELYD